MALQLPMMDNQPVIDVVDRITTIANSEAGCERANSKYNRSKNKLSSTMKLPMILARNRVGGNGPPLHLFEPDPVFHYWKKHHKRLALKSKETDKSRVLERIRITEEKKFTSNIFYKS